MMNKDAKEKHTENAQKTNACDCISRQAAIAEFSCCELTPDGGIDANYAIDFLEHMQTAQTERKTGKWVDAHRSKWDGTRYWFRQCDQCLYEREDCDPEKDTNFCPNCGSDNRGEQYEYSN